MFLRALFGPKKGESNSERVSYLLQVSCVQSKSEGQKEFCSDREVVRTALGCLFTLKDSLNLHSTDFIFDEDLSKLVCLH